MAESKNSFINQILDSFARDLGFKNRMSEMGGNINNTFKDMRNTLNSMSLDGLRDLLQKTIHGGPSVSSAAKAQKMVNDQSKKGFKSFKQEQKLRKSLKSDMGSQVGRPRANKGSSAVGTTGMGVRSGAKTGTAKRKSSVKDVAPLGGSSYKIKSGDTLSAIARRNNTTVAALMKMNPKIKDKDKIRAGQFIKVGKPKTEAFRIKEKKRSGTTDPARTIAEAKRRGLTTYTPKGSNTPKAAVTADELKKSGLSLRAYLNKMKKKKK